MRINNNIPALMSFNALTRNNNAISKSIQQISTGLRINSAADDAAGLAISENMRAQTKSLDRAINNVQDGISLIQTAEGALGETNSMLQRMRELSVQAANDTLTSQDRSYIQMEIDELKTNIDRIAGTTQFNKKSLLDGGVCGTCVASDTKTKGHIRGALQAEGNYRLEIKADPGQAQAQKSSIFKIKHENVATGIKMNADNGMGNVKINNMPAGFYDITATTAAGGAVSVSYDSKLTGKVTAGNESGFPETMDLTFTDSEGEKATLTVSLASTDTTKELTAAAIATQLNGKSITIGENSYELSVTNNGDGTYTVSSTGNSGITSITSSTPVVDASETTALSAGISSEGTNTVYTDITTGTVLEEYKDITTGTVLADLTDSTEIEFTFKNSLGSATKKITVPAGSAENAAQYIAETLNGKEVEIDGKKYSLQGEYKNNQYYITTTTRNSSERITTITTDKTEVAKTTDHNGSTLLTDLTDSTEIEFTFKNSLGSATKKITVPAGSAENVAQYIADTLNGQEVEIDGKKHILLGEYKNNQYYITTTTKNSSERITAITTDKTEVAKTTDHNGSTLTSKYETTLSGTVTHGNTNTVKEKITFTFHDNRSRREYKDPVTGEAYTKDTIGVVNPHDSDGYYKYTLRDTIEIEVDSGMSESEIAEKIKEAADAKGSLTFAAGTSSETIGITGTNDAAKYEIKTDEYSHSPAFIVKINVTPVIDPSGSTTASSDSGYPKEVSTTASSAVVSLTGFYGSEEAASSLSANVDINTQNNASILFEVTGETFDETLGTKAIVLTASSHVLGTDGTTSNYTKSKIIFSSSDSSPVDISELLGENKGALTLSLDPSKFKGGDKFVYSVSGNGKSNAKADTSLYINGSQDSSWPYSWGSDGYMTYKNNTLYYNVNADAVSNSELHFRTYYLNSDNGKVHDGEIMFKVKSDFGTKAAGFPDPTYNDKAVIGSFTANYVGKVAGGDTKLRDLEQFWNKSGVFMLEQPQTITITQNDGRRTSITLNAADTLNDVRQKLNDAIAEGLGHGLYVSGGNANKIVTFVENPDDGSGLETVKGTFLIRSLIPGSAGELTFSSSYGELIDSLGLNTVQDSKESSYTVSVYNAHNNSVIARNVKTSGNMLEGVIDKNLDVEFDAMSGVNATWSERDKNFVFAPETSSYTTTIHVVKNNISFQIGAGEKEEIVLDIGDMSSSGLGISGINVMTHDRASRAIGILDRALRRVSSQRAKLGSYQNELEHAMENLTTTSEHMISAESRIRDADMSKSMMDLVKFQIINQSSTSMLAQANQLPQSVLNLIRQ